MSDRSELEELRRLDELERKAGGQQSAPAQQQQPTDPDRPQPQQSPSKWYEDLNAGIASGASRIVRGVGTLLPDDIVAPLEKRGIIPSAQDVKTLQGMADTTLGKVGDVGMDVATVAGLPMGAVAGAASKVPVLARALQARGILPAIARTADVAATQGAVGGALSPDDRSSGAAWGAGGGVVGQALARTMGGLVRPTAEARTLMDAGVALTPGQAAGAGSLVKRAEEAAASLPVASHFVRSAQRRAVGEANRAAAQTVVDIPNLVQQRVELGMPPREALEHARETVSGAYSNALTDMDVPALFPQSVLLSRLADLPTDFPLLPARDFRAMERFVNTRMGDLARQSGGTITGEQMKQLDSEIGAHVRNLRNSPTAADKTAAPAWAELQAQMRSAMEFAQADPAKQAQLQAANDAYRQLLILERSLLPGAETFTPRQLARQVEKARLQGTPLNDVSNAMTATLPNNLPDSGTAERLLMTSLPALLMGGGAGAQGMGFDTLGAGMMAAGALGSRPGARFMTGGYSSQQALAEALRRYVPAAMRNANNGDK